MQVLDFNTTIGHRTAQPYDQSLGSLLEGMDAPTVAAGVVCSLKAIHYDAHEGNQELLDVCSGRPHLIPAGAVDLRDYLRWEKDLDHCLENGVRVFRFFPEEHGWDVSSLLFQKALARLRGAATCLILSASAGGPGHAEAIARATATAYTPVVFTDVSYHNMAEVITVMQEYLHVRAETSWLATTGALDIMASEVGTERLLFGSAAPLRPLQKALNQVLESSLPDEEKAAIVGVNALRLLGLPSKLLEERPHLPGPEPLVFEEEAIDVHAHLGHWRYAIPGEDYNPAGMLDRMKRFKISHSIVSSYEAMRCDIKEGNRRLASAIRNYDGLFGYVELDPHQIERSCTEMDTYYARDDFVGAEIELTHTGASTASTEVRKLVAEVARRGRPVLFKPAGAGDAPAEKRLAQDNPGLQIIHAHGMDARWAETIQDAPNILVEFCYSRPNHQDIKHCLEILGPERILFGTDQTLLSVGAAVGLYMDAAIPQEYLRMVLRENAKRIFRGLSH